MAAVVYDLGGTHLRCAFVCSSPELKSFEKFRIDTLISGSPREAGWDKIIESMIGYEKRAGAAAGANAPIVISFPGPITQPSKIEGAPTLLLGGTRLPDLAGALNKATGRRVHIINDLSAAAWHLSRTVDSERFVAVTVSSGIGSKIFDRSRPAGVIDSVPYAGEIGHLRVDSSPDAPACDCGGKGHLGAVSSGRGIERHANSAARANPAAFNSSLCALRFQGIPGRLTNEDHIVPAAKLGDEWALNVIRDCTAPLARTLLSLTLACGLDKIIIIGGFAFALGEIYLQTVQNLMVQQCDYDLMQSSVSRLAELGNTSEETCLAGAAVYAKHIPQNYFQENRS